MFAKGIDFLVGFKIFAPVHAIPLKHHYADATEASARARGVAL